MKRLMLVTAAGLTAASAPAAAQSHLDLTLNWLEVAAGTNTPVANPNGILEPDESARIAISVSFTPPVGTTLSYNPPPGSGTGTVAGFGRFSVDLAVGDSLNPSASGIGTWDSIQRAPGWALGWPGRVLSAGASVRDIDAGQFMWPGSTANPANPIPSIWLGIWTPTVFSHRAVTWQLSSAITAGAPTTGLYLQIGIGPGGEPQYIAVNPSATYGTTTIPIVPAPASLVALSALFLQRRRRGP